MIPRADMMVADRIGTHRMPETFTLSARWVFPVAGPPLENGTITVRDGRVESVDAAGCRTPDESLGNVAIIPGLVNAHTHLDLTGARGRTPPTDAHHFTDWLRQVIAYRRGRTPEDVQNDVRLGLAECLRAGTTLIGDIASEGASWNALHDADTRAVVFREVIGLGSNWQDRYFDAHAWLLNHADSPKCRRAISPHAPYTVRALLFSLLANRCIEDGLVSAVHIAEAPAEAELLAEHSGEFVEFLRGFQFEEWNALIPSHRELISSMSNVSTLFVHGNTLPPNTPFGPNHSVVYCPRTHHAFGHAPHPYREFICRGVRVCLGTDSLASNPDLDILAEARFLHDLNPDLPGETLLRMITLSGAEALEWDDEAGSLEVGKSADLVAIPLPNRDAADPHDLLFADHPGERRTLFQGVWRG